MVGPRRRQVQTGNTIHISLAEKRTRRGTRTVFKPQKSEPSTKFPRDSSIPFQHKDGDLVPIAWEDNDDTHIYDSGTMAVPTHTRKEKQVGTYISVESCKILT